MTTIVSSGPRHVFGGFGYSARIARTCCLGHVVLAAAWDRAPTGDRALSVCYDPRLPDSVEPGDGPQWYQQIPYGANLPFGDARHVVVVAVAVAHDEDDYELLAFVVDGAFFAQLPLVWLSLGIGGFDAAYGPLDFGAHRP